MAILSPFSLDRGGDFEALNQSIQMVSGAVAGFSLASVVTFAEQSVDGVSGIASSAPIDVGI